MHRVSEMAWRRAPRALVGALVILIAACGGDAAEETTDMTADAATMTGVTIVESFAVALAENDFESARRYVDLEGWGEPQRNLLEYWEALGARVLLRDCRQSEPELVSCNRLLDGLHYGAVDGETGASVEMVVDGVIRAGAGFDQVVPAEGLDADVALAEFGAAQDPDGVAAACQSEGEGTLLRSGPLVYRASCGEYLTEVVGDWIMASFEHLPVEIPDGSTVVEDLDEWSPMYARVERLSGEPLPSLSQPGDGWRLIYFYRPPECIPADYDLLDFFDFERAAECGPVLIDGRVVFEGEAVPPPLAYEGHGRGDVPVWLFPAEDWAAATADGRATIEELESLGPVKGTAAELSEVLVVETDIGGPFTLSVEGTLEDGRSFKGVRKDTVDMTWSYLEVGL